MALTQRHARRIARKLGAEITADARHDIAIIRDKNGIILGKYGIRRASKELGHDYIPGQIHVAMRQAQNLANCPMSKEDYFTEMRRQGRI